MPKLGIISGLGQPENLNPKLRSSAAHSSPAAKCARSVTTFACPGCGKARGLLTTIDTRFRGPYNYSRIYVNASFNFLQSHLNFCTWPGCAKAQRYYDKKSDFRTPPAGVDELQLLLRYPAPRLVCSFTVLFWIICYVGKART